MNSKELRDAFLDIKSTSKRATEYLAEALGDRRNSFQRVREFMEKFGHPVYDEPGLIQNPEWEKMRLRLIQEEFAELLEACGYPESARWIRDVVLIRNGDANIVGVADALGDLEYVVNAMAIGCGINLPEVVAEIHRSNMTKLGRDGKPVYREDGKILKGEDYEPPDLRTVLFGPPVV